MTLYVVVQLVHCSVLLNYTKGNVQYIALQFAIQCHKFNILIKA